MTDEPRLFIVSCLIDNGDGGVGHQNFAVIAASPARALDWAFAKARQIHPDAVISPQVEQIPSIYMTQDWGPLRIHIDPATEADLAPIREQFLTRYNEG